MNPLKNLRGWPLCIVIFFVILFVVDGLFIYTAVSTQDGIVPSYSRTQER